MGVCLELPSLGSNCQRSLAPKFCYPQVAVESSDGVLTDDIALLFLHGEGKSPVHILIYLSAC